MFRELTTSIRIDMHSPSRHTQFRLKRIVGLVCPTKMQWIDLEEAQVMTKTRCQRSVPGSPKKNIVPLSKLRTSEVVRTVVDHPRRLDELVALLQDKERKIRGRAAVTLARLSESHPARLLRHLERLRGFLSDDSAFVRWHLLYVLGRVLERFPGKAAGLLSDVGNRLADEDRIVRVFACRALEWIATRNPMIIVKLFEAKPGEMPPSLVRLLQVTPTQAKGPARS
jgi:hypothetical protein